MDNFLNLEGIEDLPLLPEPNNRGSEQSTAALIASSMSGQYEEDWSATTIFHKALTTLGSDTASCNSDISKYYAFNDDYSSDATQVAIGEDTQSTIILPSTEVGESCNYTDLDSFQSKTVHSSEGFLSETHSTNSLSGSIQLPEISKLQTDDKEIATKKKKLKGLACARKSTHREKPQAELVIKVARPKIARPKKLQTNTEDPVVSVPSTSFSPMGKILAKKVPSYLTAFPMHCLDCPMVFCCNDCARIFTTIRAGQLHECIKKRRGRKPINSATPGV